MPARTTNQSTQRVPFLSSGACLGKFQWRFNHCLETIEPLFFGFRCTADHGCAEPRRKKSVFTKFFVHSTPYCNVRFKRFSHRATETHGVDSHIPPLDTAHKTIHNTEEETQRELGSRSVLCGKGTTLSTTLRCGSSTHSGARVPGP